MNIYLRLIVIILLIILVTIIDNLFFKIPLSILLIIILFMLKKNQNKEVRHDERTLLNSLNWSIKFFIISIGGLIIYLILTVNNVLVLNLNQKDLLIYLILILGTCLYVIPNISKYK